MATFIEQLLNSIRLFPVVTSLWKPHPELKLRLQQQNKKQKNQNRKKKKLAFKSNWKEKQNKAQQEKQTQNNPSPQKKPNNPPPPKKNPTKIKTNSIAIHPGVDEKLNQIVNLENESYLLWNFKFVSALYMKWLAVNVL